MVPLWREFDPLPVLGGDRRRKRSTDDDDADAKDRERADDLGPEDLLFQVAGNQG